QRAAPASITIVVADNKASEFKATSGESSTGARWRIISDTEWNAEQAKQAEALGDETRQGPTLDDIDGLFEEADADLDLQTEFTRNLWHRIIARNLLPNTAPSEALFTAVFERLYYHLLPLVFILAPAHALHLQPTTTALLIAAVLPFIGANFWKAHDPATRPS